MGVCLNKSLNMWEEGHMHLSRKNTGICGGWQEGLSLNVLIATVRAVVTLSQWQSFKPYGITINHHKFN